MSEISIIVPIYNVEKYLEKCLKSLLNQTLPKEKFEIILIDDGSTDSSGLIADTYAKNFPFIRVVHKKNAGLPQARKTGVSIASGNYIAFVDPDDWIESNMYTRLLETIQSTDADMACCNYILEYENKKVKMNFDNPSEIETMSGYQALLSVHKRNAVFQFAWNKLYRRELFENIIFPQENIIGEDYSIVVQIILKCRRVTYITDKLYHYLQRQSSMCKSAYSEFHKKTYINYNTILEMLLNKFPEEKTIFINYHIQEWLFIIIPMSRNRKYDISIISKVRKDIKKNIVQYLKVSGDSWVIKIAVCLFIVSPRGFLRLYQTIYNRGK